MLPTEIIFIPQPPQPPTIVKIGATFLWRDESAMIKRKIEVRKDL
jgi:hypothetical protein